MTSCTLNITIATADLTDLKKSGYSLCVAKKVNDRYNVVWRGDQKYLHKNVFKMEDDYQVYGVDQFIDGALVEASTNVVGISGGETAVLDEEGVMNDPTDTPIMGQPLTVKNHFGSIHFGVDALIGGKYSSIYVSENPFASGTVSLAPMRRVMVWFDKSSKTGTMFTEAISNAFEVDFTQTDSASISYASSDDEVGNGTWFNGDAAALGTIYDPKSNQFMFNTKRIPSVGEMDKLNELFTTNKDHKNN